MMEPGRWRKKQEKNLQDRKEIEEAPCCLGRHEESKLKDS